MKYFPVIAAILLCSSAACRAAISIETPAWQKVREWGKKNCYVFLFISDEKKNAVKMRAALDEAAAEIKKQKKNIKLITIESDDPKEAELIDIFRIRETPTALVIAPNGAITGYFPLRVDTKKLLESILPEKETEIIENLQEGRIVFLCFRGEGDASYEERKSNLISVANNFKGAVTAIYVGSGEEGDAKLRGKFAPRPEASTVFIIAPPGRAIAKLEGAGITKQNLMRALLARRGGGCCGGGARTCR